MKNKLNLLALATLGTTLSLSYPVWGDNLHHGRGGFMQGVCVGQELAKQGVTLPTGSAGQPSNWDASTQEAFKSAVQSCKGEETTPSPSSTSSASPTANN